MRHGLSNEARNAIEDLFPEPAPTGRPPADPRKMLLAMIWLNNTGAKLRHRPSELMAWQTVFKYFDRWNGDGTLQETVNRLGHFAIDNDDLYCGLLRIDGTILRAHRCAAGGGKEGF